MIIEALSEESCKEASSGTHHRAIYIESTVLPNNMPPPELQALIVDCLRGAGIFMSEDGMVWGYENSNSRKVITAIKAVAVAQLGEDAPASLQAILESHPQSLCVDFQLEQMGGFKLYKDAPTSAYAQLLPFGGTEAAPVAHGGGDVCSREENGLR